MIRRRIFNKGTKKDKDRINKRVIKIRIYEEKKGGGSLRDKKGYVFKRGNGIPFYLTFQNKNRGQI